MDLHTIETYLRPTALEQITAWQPGWAWLAGGTWMFSEPRPQTHTLVDLHGLGWSELDITPDGLTIGATCIMNRLLQATYPANWTAITALQQAVHELASFKVQNVATIAGNLCLAIPAGTFAPAMVALDACYDLVALDGSIRTVPALQFQTGMRQTILQSGEVLRKIWIPAANLEWQTSYKRLCMASAGLALSIVVAAYHPSSDRVRFGISGCVTAPRLLEFASIPTPEELTQALDRHLPLAEVINDTQGSAAYRRHLTHVLMQRSLEEVLRFGA
jgi:CO/xanthine dehydrogenase FAD-binding subunit